MVGDEAESKEEVKDNEIKEGAGEVEAKEIETSKGEGFVELDKDEAKAKDTTKEAEEVRTELQEEVK